jgi:hypothetical protein
MEFKGTKGEWSYIAGNINQLTVIKIGDAHEFELEINGKNRIEEEIANAQLISCAPEILEMLEKVCIKLKGNGFPMLQTEIEQLIKKATEI